MSSFASANQQVKEVQEALNKLGYNVGKPDGVMGRYTRKLLRKYQKDHGLKPTGKPNKATMDKLKGVKPKKSLKSAMAKGHAAVKKGHYNEAMKWFKMESKTGNAEALFMLATFYEQGLGVKENIKLAVKIYTKSAKNGHLTAQINLALIYLNGEKGIKKDITKAAALFYKATKQGDIHAKYHLGKILLDQGNYKKSKKWLIKAAAQNDKDAQYALGMMYYKGLGVSKSLNTASFWIKKAAQQNHMKAQDMLKKIKKFKK